MYSVTFRDKEIENPVLRAIVAVFLVIYSILIVVLLVILSPLLLLLHMWLRSFNRRGFAYWTYSARGKHLHVDFSKAAFDRY